MFYPLLSLLKKIFKNKRLKLAIEIAADFLFCLILTASLIAFSLIFNFPDISFFILLGFFTGLFCIISILKLLQKFIKCAII